ncbi:SRPBCC family protein [Pseudonocardia spinosispora]|uniref:SRPBCC family protein n=1 Tax=Pseudonocardia spinosispora TaxID=103441 RepID=UPI00042619F9|nr:SRPBCC domain-containing protein [Pseudonocardia spinosispora]
MRSAEPIVKEIEIAASPEVVFEFFTDPEKITRWLAREATLDPRPGGVCHQVHEGRPGLGSFHMRGEFLEVDHPKRVVFTWGFDESSIGIAPGESTVEVTFSPIPTGTKVILVHSGLPVSEVDNHSEGWTSMLERLREAVTGS